jgi:hypothetical protein
MDACDEEGRQGVAPVTQARLRQGMAEAQLVAKPLVV